jgi:signal transduction histidine kinase
MASASVAATLVRCYTLRMVSYRERYEELRDLLEARNQFYLDAVHEIHTPLAAVLGLAEIMLSDRESPLLADAHRKHVRMIRNQARHLDEIVKDLIELERIERQEISYEFVHFDVRKVLEETVPLVRGILQSKPGLRFSLGLARELPSVHGDVRRIKQVLMNFLQNAVLFTNEGSIRVNAAGTEGFVRIEVSDTGVGISGDEQELIWEQLKRRGGSVSPELEGAGLGLTINKKIVEAHRGEIGVRSVIGEGSTFWFTLPTCESGRLPVEKIREGNQVREKVYTPPPHSTAAEQILEIYEGPDPLPLADVEYPVQRKEKTTRLPPGRGETILVVDDTPANVEIMRSILEEANYQVLTAADGPEAIALLGEETPDLIITDLWMPKMSGFDLITKIRQEDRFRTVPIVLLTGRRLKDDILYGLQIGCDDTIPKPFYRGELLARVSVLLRMRALQEELRRWNEVLEGKVKERSRQLEAVQERLVVSEKMSSLGRLTAGIAHELNNPIGYVRSNVSILSSRYDDALLAMSIRDAALAFAEETTDEGREAVALSLLDRLANDTRFVGDVSEFRRDAGDDRAGLLGLFPEFLRYLREETRPDAPVRARKLFTSTEQGLRRVTEIVADLKTFSHPDGFVKGAIDINPGVQRVVKILASLIEEGEVHVETDLRLESRVQGSSGRLDQVFMNLVSNAVQACEPGGTVRIETHEDGGRALVTVTDTGHGIPEERRKRIFDPFFTTKPVGQGQGLGLAIVYRIVEGHGGELDFESAENEGTIFRVRLPLAP